MAAAQITHQLVEQVTLIWDAPKPSVSEVVVGTAEGKVRFKGGFFGQGQPVVVAKGHVRASACGWTGERYHRAGIGRLWWWI